jgi:hypothetical protein
VEFAAGLDREGLFNVALDAGVSRQRREGQQTGREDESGSGFHAGMRWCLENPARAGKLQLFRLILVQSRFDPE